ncbi:hypothetical protein RRG08_010694 [Elysia crispata]|uniref:Uncharacterized protein n=1 Tax=Elysia crispata TaxID=231223 RepID=A0AAE0YXS8_9GAST|nr:hypothetical protein RRG08_010694 [Elysia crispata]
MNGSKLLQGKNSPLHHPKIMNTSARCRTVFSVLTKPTYTTGLYNSETKDDLQLVLLPLNSPVAILDLEHARLPLAALNLLAAADGRARVGVYSYHTARTIVQQQQRSTQLSRFKEDSF